MGFGLREPSHWIPIILLVVIIFGWKRLPDASRSLARSLKIFKNELTNEPGKSTPPTPTTPVDGEVVTPPAATRPEDRA